MINTVKLTNGSNLSIDKLVWLNVRKLPIVNKALKMEEDFTVETVEGIFNASAGDYLIIGTTGEFLPIKKEIFENTYEIINDGDLNVREKKV